MVRKWAAALDDIEKADLDGRFAKARCLMEIADDLAAQNPKVVGVFANGLAGISLGQVTQERPETVDNALAGQDVVIGSAPASRPVVQIGIESGQPPFRCQAWMVYGGSFRLGESLCHGSDHNSKPLLSINWIRL